jgi:hypothetical protein
VKPDADRAANPTGRRDVDGSFDLLVSDILLEPFFGGLEAPTETRIVPMPRPVASPIEERPVRTPWSSALDSSRSAPPSQEGKAVRRERRLHAGSRISFVVNGGVMLAAGSSFSVNDDLMLAAEFRSP